MFQKIKELFYKTFIITKLLRNSENNLIIEQWDPSFGSWLPLAKIKNKVKLRKILDLRVYDIRNVIKNNVNFRISFQDKYNSELEFVGEITFINNEHIKFIIIDEMFFLSDRFENNKEEGFALVA